MTDVITNGLSRGEMIAFAAALERESEHPLARAVVAAADAEQAELKSADSFENVRGQGAIAVVAGRQVVIGSRRLLTDRSIGSDVLEPRRAELAEGGRTAIFVAIDGVAVAVIGMADVPRSTWALMVRELRALGIAIGAGTDVAIETADVVLMGSDALDISPP